MRSLVLLLCLPWCPAAPSTSACLRAARRAIAATPRDAEGHATTSRLYKRHVAEHFCGLSGDMTVLELGVYEGHTTAVLASIFQKVIAVDLKKRFLTSAAKTLGRLTSNVVFLEMDLLVDSWSLFAINQVDVVVIDANHDYEYVRADAENALCYLPDLKFLVFHDAWLKEVQRAVTELETAGRITCKNIGLGADGHPYPKRDWDPVTQRIYVQQSVLPEGKLCRRTGGVVAPSFAEKRYLIYGQPMTTMNMCPGAFLRPYSNGVLKAGFWNSGTWRTLRNESSQRNDRIMVRLPSVSELPMEMLFNVDRTAFMLIPNQFAGSGTEYFGISDQLVYRPFRVAEELFEQ